jgi:hypothetical protein
MKHIKMWILELVNIGNILRVAIEQIVWVLLLEVDGSISQLAIDH